MAGGLTRRRLLAAAGGAALGVAAAFVVRGEDGLHETVSPAFAAMAAEGA